MKHTLLLLVLLAGWIGSTAQAQVLNSARSLPGRTFVLAGAPVVFNNDGANALAMFVMGRYGVGTGLDFEARAGFFEDGTLVGGSVELGLRPGPPYVSLMTGLHVQNDLAFDGGLNIAYPLSETLDLYGGIDFDLIFDDDPDLPTWANLGIDVMFIEQVHFLAEFNLGVNEISPNIWGASFVFHF
ncbi:MAG: hypothetical protein R2834_05755 [Rhodothermales bacterium]